MIIWIASFPKSGNTLLRSVLGTYFFSDDGVFDFKYTYKIGQFPSLEYFDQLGIDISSEQEIMKNYIKAQTLFNKKYKKIKFLKTHSSLFERNLGNFTDLENTLGAIYIVRDPRNVVASYSYHYSINPTEAVNLMCNNDLFIPRAEGKPQTYLSSWRLNYLSWKRLRKRVLIVKYEDLVFNKKKTLLNVFKFFQSLGMNKSSFNISKLNKAIKTTEFNKMKELEKKKIFTEGIIDKNTGKRKPFFNLGPNNSWKNTLDDLNRKKIETEFEKEMIELGYL